MHWDDDRHANLASATFTRLLGMAHTVPIYENDIV